MSIFVCKLFNFQIFLQFFAENKNMKKVLSMIFVITFLFFAHPCRNDSSSRASNLDFQKPMMAIVIDDFGSYDQSGVQKMLSVNASLTCACLPNVDNTDLNISQITDAGHELILHMPMQSHVRLPESWYGPVYIKNYDSPEIAKQKLTEAISSFPGIKGFNIHIGSGVGRNKNLMKSIYKFANDNGLYFLDSRTIVTSATEEASKETNSIYLGRDVFLEADKNKSYAGVTRRLFEGAEIAKQKGYSIVIGHVGAEGGENTANAIFDHIDEIKQMGVEIVSLSKIYEKLKNM